MLVTAAAIAVTALLLPAVATGWRAVSGGEAGATAFADFLVWGCAGVGIVVTCWLWLVSCVVVLDASRGLEAARFGVPDAVRRGVLVLCGAAITSGLAAPAHAGGTTPAPDPPHVLTGLRLPERVEVTPLPPASDDQRAAPSPAPEPGSVVVEPGDTLWAIAAAHLGSGVTDGETAQAWPAIYALNRHLIGPDPSLITPGQRLVLPAIGHEGSDR
jgi:hypothetical protein